MQHPLQPGYDNNNNPSTDDDAYLAIGWDDTNSPPPTDIDACYCWFGKYPISTWTDVFTDPSDVALESYNNYPWRTNWSRAARQSEADVPTELLMKRQGLAAEREGNFAEAAGIYRQALAEHPTSRRAHRLVGRAFVSMAESGASREEIEAFFRPYAEGNAEEVHPLVIDAAQEHLRQAKARFGDYTGAMTDYRAVAEDASLSLGRRLQAWLEVASLARLAGNEDARAEALAIVLRDGAGTDYEDIVLANYTDTAEPEAAEEDTAATVISGLQASPNPFNPTTTLHYSLDAPGAVRMAVYNAAGQLVRTLVNAEMAAGAHSVAWNGADDNGRRVASGVYLIRLTTPGATHTTRVTMTY